MILNDVYVCACMWVSAHNVKCGRSLNPLELELETAVGLLLRVLRTKPWLTGRVVSALNC